MTIQLEVDGIRYDNFESANIEIRMDALCRTFGFSAVAAGGVPLPFRGGEAARAYVNGKKVLTGWIEVVDVSYDSRIHMINVSGRDKTGDLLDSTISKISDLRAPITLKEVIEKVIDHIGADIKVVDEVEPPPFEESQDLIAPEPGDNAFKFIEKLSRKRQVILRSNPSGDVVIAKGEPGRGSGAVQHIIGAEDNNVLASNFSFDTTGRFNSYQFASQLNPAVLNLAGKIGLDSVANQGGGASDPDVRSGRQLVLVAEAPFSNDQNEARAKWEANIRKARGLVYSATVPGFAVDGGQGNDLWDVAKVYPIHDDYVGKVEPMLCNTVTFTLDSNSGSQTSLGFVDRKAYTLELNKPKVEKTAALIL